MPARRATGDGAKGDGHGDARAGAGRKRNVLPADVRDRLGNPAIDKPLKLRRWYSLALSELLWLYLALAQRPGVLRKLLG